MKPKKLRIRLPRKARIGRVVGLCMAGARGTARINAGGLRASGDPEFLHQMRVSVRGARALLKSLGSMYDPRDVDRLASELAWLGGVTNPTRDLDVFYEMLPHYSEALTLEVRGDLEPFRQLLRDRRRLASQEVTDELNSKRYRTLMKEWKRFAAGAKREGRRPDRPSRRLAKAWIWKRYRRTRKWFEALDVDSSPAEVHRARIELKKLRYLIEFFRSLFPKNDVESVLGPLKAAQDALGVLNDVVVHRSMIRRIARSAEFTHLLPSDTVIAMGELSARLDSERRVLMADLPGRMKALSSKKSRRRFRELYRP